MAFKILNAPSGPYKQQAVENQSIAYRISRLPLQLPLLLLPLLLRCSCSYSCSCSCPPEPLTAGSWKFWQLSAARRPALLLLLAAGCWLLAGGCSA